MDKITLSLLTEFSTEFDIAGLPEDDRFEHFTAWLTVRRHYTESTFDPGDLVTGEEDDTGIDAVAVIINNNLVTDLDTVDDLLEVNGYLDVTFVFVQSERSSHFDGAKIGTFGYGVRDFFGEARVRQSSQIKYYLEIMNSVYSRSSKFRPANPACILYYITTGTWSSDQNLVARMQAEQNLLSSTNLFRRVDFIPIGANEIQQLYHQTKNAVTKQFVFDRKNSLPRVAGVREAYLGFIPAPRFLTLVRDDSNNIIKSLFYENVRDWEGYNSINSEIRDALSIETRDRFVLMNNGITIIARQLHTTGDAFTISDFQVVNGCQTSHVLHENSDLVTDNVQVPLRLICTQDEDVFEAIIRATNRQTEVKAYQFFAMKDFAKKLEAYFKTFPVDKRLYYERRSNQYNSGEIERKRIIAHKDLVRAVGAAFLGYPHITTRTFRALEAKVGDEMFRETDRQEPYYAAALALYTGEQLFRSKKLSAKYKPARYQLLLIVRLLMDRHPLPPMNSNRMGKLCDTMIQSLGDEQGAEDLFQEATQILDSIAGADWDRDSIRTEPITKAIFEHFGQRYERRRQEPAENSGVGV